MDAIRFVNYTGNSTLKNYISKFGIGRGHIFVNYFSQRLSRGQIYDEKLKKNWLTTARKEATKLVRLDV
jgi:hypothetical protein